MNLVITSVLQINTFFFCTYTVYLHWKLSILLDNNLLPVLAPYCLAKRIKKKLR